MRCWRAVCKVLASTNGELTRVEFAVGATVCTHAHLSIQAGFFLGKPVGDVRSSDELYLRRTLEQVEHPLELMEAVWLRASTSAVPQADRLRGAAHPVVNIRTSEHHILSRPLLSVRMFGSWGKKRANAHCPRRWQDLQRGVGQYESDLGLALPIS